MKISTRGRYGLRLLIDLAFNTDEIHVSLSSVADRQRISARYLEQVAVILKRAGFIRSIKGASGGYILAMPPSDIVVGDVLRALEGDMSVVEPPRLDKPETKLQRCVRINVYDKLDQRILAVINSQTLASLVGAGNGTETLMYYI